MILYLYDIKCILVMALAILMEKLIQGNRTNEHWELKILFENVLYVQEFEKHSQP